MALNKGFFLLCNKIMHFAEDPFKIVVFYLANMTKKKNL